MWIMWIPQRSGNKIILLHFIIQQLGYPPSRPCKAMNQVILLALENALQNIPKQNRRKTAQLLHVYRVLQEAGFPLCSLPTEAASKGNGWRSSVVFMALCWNTQKLHLKSTSRHIHFCYKHNPYDGKIEISEDKIILPNCQAHYLSVVFFCLSLSSYSPNTIYEQADLLFQNP